MPIFLTSDAAQSSSGPADSEALEAYLLITKSSLSREGNPIRLTAESEGVSVVTSDAAVAEAFGIEPSDGKEVLSALKHRGSRFVRRICTQMYGPNREIRFFSSKGKAPDGWDTVGAIFAEEEQLIEIRKLCPTDNDLALRWNALFTPLVRAVLNDCVFHAEGRTADGRTFSEGPFFSEFDVLNSILSNYRRFWQS